MTLRNTLDRYLAPFLSENPTGIIETKIEGVRLFWSTKSTPPEPQMYEPGVVLILRGRKEAQINGKTFVYDKHNYLVLTLPMPFLCAHCASLSEPLCGLFIQATRSDLSSLLCLMPEVLPMIHKAQDCVLAPVPIDWQMRLTLDRLVSILDDELAARVIGSALRREVFFHALRGPSGPDLITSVQQTGDGGKLDRLIENIQSEIAQSITTEEMAHRAGMSLSTFHRVFRQRTGQSPLQYVKQLRLHAARDLIAFKGSRVGDAARQVGYDSPSQFSREFKRYFGISAKDCQRLK